MLLPFQHSPLTSPPSLLFDKTLTVFLFTSPYLLEFKQRTFKAESVDILKKGNIVKWSALLSRVTLKCDLDAGQPGVFISFVHV